MRNSKQTPEQLLGFREEIKVLDATVRDGGLVNSFRFTDEFVRELYKTNIKAGVDYKWVDAEENVELTTKLGVKKAPTLLVPHDDGFDAFENASNIKGYIEGLK